MNEREQDRLQQEIDRERESLLEQLQRWLEVPMIILAFAWLALFVIEVVWALTPALSIVGHVIWIAFIIEWALGFTVAPRKRDFLERNWLKTIALIAPGLRVLRIASLARVARLPRAARSLRLLRLLSSLNRGMRALGASMGRRGFGYVVVLTLIVTAAGAAGMYAFERGVANDDGLTSYATSLWWTAMVVITMGSEYWPRTPEGRALCLMLALYGLGVFGYVTATLATFFIGQDAQSEETELPSARSVAALRSEIAALREEMRSLRS